MERIVAPAIRAFRPDLILVGAATTPPPATRWDGWRRPCPASATWTERAVALARRVLRRAARRVPRGRLLAAPPARREPRDRRGARRPAAEHRGRPGRPRRPGQGLRQVERAAVDAAASWAAGDPRRTRAGGSPRQACRRRCPQLAGDIDADVVVVGGGYTGLWTAWGSLSRSRRAVVVLEADRCGLGPSGRNGGFLFSLWLYLRRCAASTARRRRSRCAWPRSESVEAIGAWCEAQEVDAWYREAPHLVVSCAPAQDGASAARSTARTSCP